jgi:cytochrome c biogenesis protein CcmG, thiol:disulfide interchange protein DsbE
VDRNEKCRCEGLRKLWRRKARRVAVFSLLVGALALQPHVSWSQHTHPAQTSAPVIGGQAIPFELRLLDDRAVTLESFHGQPLVVNFFASWCDPCRDEMPLINELAANANKAGYRVLGIAVEDTRAGVTQFLKETNLNFPIALDLNSTVKRSYRIFGPPASFFIDKEGVICDVVLGPITSARMGEAMKKTGISR